MSKYRYTGLTPGVLADGRPLAPGQNVDNVDLKHADNQLLIDDGVLQALPTASRKTADKEVSK
jgi:hypothetical protein